MAEHWVALKDFPNYQVNPEGRVRVEKNKGNGRTWRELRPHNDAEGNLKVWVFSPQTGHVELHLAELVLEAFVEVPEPDAENQLWVAFHKDGDPGNCFYSNLMWVKGNEEAPTVEFKEPLQPSDPLNRLYHMELVTCHRRTGKMMTFSNLNHAAKAMDISLEQLLVDLKVKPGDCDFLSMLKMQHVKRSATVPTSKKTKRKDKVIAFDFVSNSRVVSPDPGTLAILTGLQESEIWDRLNNRNYDMIAGYVVKWFKDPMPFPSIKREEATKSRVEYFIPKAGEEPRPKIEMKYQLKHTATGVTRHYPSLEALCEDEGWTLSVVTKLAEEFTNGVTIGAYRLSPC